MLVHHRLRSQHPTSSTENEWGVAKPSAGALSAPKAPVGGYIEDDWNDQALTRKLADADAEERQARLARFINEESAAKPVDFNKEDGAARIAAAADAIREKKTDQPVVIDVLE